MINTSVLKKNNMLEIIKMIKNSGSITKPEIVKLTGFASATVHNLVNELQKKGILNEEGNADSNGGRKALLYSFNAQKYYVLGLDIGVKKVAASVFDLDLNSIDTLQKKYDIAALTVEEGINFAINLIKELIAGLNISKEKIIGLGICVPGPVNFHKGLVVKLTNANKWRNIPLKEIMENELGIHVIVDNDSNGSVLSLKWKSFNGAMKNVVYLSTMEGIGTGILINGDVYRGNHHIAGEIGHLSIDLDGEKCNCGNTGCIELVSSDLGIVERTKKRIKKEDSPVILKLCNNEPNRLSMDIIVQAAKYNDAFAKQVLLDAAKYLGICLSIIVKVYDPDEIIVDSTWLKEFSELFNGIKNSVYENTEFINRDDVKIVLNKIDDIFVLGAATLILEYHFSSYENSMLLV